MTVTLAHIWRHPVKGLGSEACQSVELTPEGAVEGDRATGLRSLPVTLGVPKASRLACAVMAGAQIIVIALLLAWGQLLSAAIVALLLVGQVALMPRLLRDPAKNAPWYGATGVTLYVLGMLAAGLGLGGYFG